MDTSGSYNMDESAVVDTNIYRDVEQKLNDDKIFKGANLPMSKNERASIRRTTSSSSTLHGVHQTSEVPSPSKPKLQCMICLDFASTAAASWTGDCSHHPICDECFRDYSVSEIVTNSKTYLRCPVPGCFATFENSSRLTQALRHKLEENKEKVFRKSKICPRCQGMNCLKLGPLDRFLRTRFVMKCEACKHLFCLYCCEDFDLTLQKRHILVRAVIHISPYVGCNTKHRCSKMESSSLLTYAKETTKMFKPCPNCFQLIERTQGCNYMQCSGPLGCGHAFCWACLNSLSNYGQQHRCEVNMVDDGMLARFRENVVTTWSPILRAKARVIYTIMTRPFAWVYWRIRYYESPTGRYNRFLKTCYRVIGVNLFNVPPEVINIMIRHEERNGIDTKALGRWSDDNRCFRSYTVFGDGHTCVTLHSHEETEPCTMIDSATIRSSADAFTNCGKWLYCRLPLAHTFPENHFHHASDMPMSNAQSDEEVYNQIKIGISNAMRQFSIDIRPLTSFVKKRWLGS